MKVDTNFLLLGCENQIKFATLYVGECANTVKAATAREGILLQQFIIHCDLSESDLNKLTKEMQDFNVERRGVAHEGN